MIVLGVVTLLENPPEGKDGKRDSTGCMMIILLRMGLRI